MITWSKAVEEFFSTNQTASGGFHLMNLKELIDVVATETELPLGSAQSKFGGTRKIANLIDSQSEFVSPVITIKGFTTPAKPATDGKKAYQAQVARMSIRSKPASPPTAN